MEFVEFFLLISFNDNINLKSALKNFSHSQITKISFNKADHHNKTQYQLHAIVYAFHFVQQKFLSFFLSFDNNILSLLFRLSTFLTYQLVSPFCYSKKNLFQLSIKIAYLKRSLFFNNKKTK